MMDQLLIITDDAERSGALVRWFRGLWTCRICDLDEVVELPDDPAVIVTDVANISAQVVPRLRRFLAPVRYAAPLLVLLYGTCAHGRIQAIALGATEMLEAPTSPEVLEAVLKRLERQKSPSLRRAEALAGQAQRFIGELFVSAGPLTPPVIDSGAHLIAQAIEEAGVRAWVRAVRRFDNATHQHCLLVAGLAADFATHLGFSEADRHRLTRAALLHDVGKIHISPDILNKPGKLDADEMAVMRLHPEHGYAMLVGQGFEDDVLAVVRSHHEMLDGSGYPDGLSGDDIPDLVRLVTICDIFAALIERRSYKPPMSREAAFDILKGMVGRLDQVLVDAFRPVATYAVPITR